MRHKKIAQLVKKLLPLFLLTLLALFSQDWLLQWTVQSPGPPSRVDKGATFIRINADYLQLDWQRTFKEIINELGIHYLRLPVYWDEIEPEPGVFNWQDLDWQLQEAAKSKTKILLAIGHRVPRYPECYAPAWANQLNDQDFKQALFQMLEQVVKHYRQATALEAWQVENEPHANVMGQTWGKNCRDILSYWADEIRWVRAVDQHQHPIVVTYANVPWIVAQLRPTLKMPSDILGITMFEKLFFRSPIFNGYVEPYNQLGFFSPLSLAYQHQVIRQHGKPLWVIEMQAEPWGPHGPYDKDRQEAYKTMNPDLLQTLWQRATSAGISRIYLWGVEWWISEKQQGHPAMWNTGKNLG